jgi:DNA modification methylase
MTELPTTDDPVWIVPGDCIEQLPAMTGWPIDAVLTDPPYGIALASHGQRFRNTRPIAGDESTEVGQYVVDWCAAQGWPVLAFAHPLKPWAGQWRQHLAWDKGEAVGIGGDRKTCWKFTWELIQVGRFPEVFGKREGSVLRFPMLPRMQAEIGHPTPKSLDLMRYLVRKLVPPGGLVLDPFGGSGTTAVAAVLEGRRAILVEREPSYVEIAVKRVTEAELSYKALGITKEAVECL